MLPETEISEDRIIVNHKKSPLVIRIVLVIIMAICCLIPVFTTFFFLYYKIGLHFGLVILFLILWGSAYMLIRIILWNAYGKEIIELGNEKIIYMADYKYFKDARQEIDITGIVVEIIHEDTMDKQQGRLRLKNNEIEIESVLQTSLAHLELIVEKIKRRSGNSETTILPEVV